MSTQIRKKIHHMEALSCSRCVLSRSYISRGKRRLNLYIFLGYSKSSLWLEVGGAYMERSLNPTVSCKGKFQPDLFLPHPSLSCSFSLNCWRSLGISCPPRGVDWGGYMQAKLVEAGLCSWFFFSMTVWCIWKERNHMVFRGVRATHKIGSAK